MIINLSDIKAISECPAYYQFTKSKPRKPISLQLSVTKKVIKAAYLHTLKSHYKCTWKRIIEYIDMFLFSNKKDLDEEEYNFLKKTSEPILNFLRAWYNEIYLLDDAQCYSNIELKHDIGHFTFIGKIPVLKINDTVCIQIVTDDISWEHELKRDIKLLGLVWLLSKEMDTEKSFHIQCLVMSPKGTLKVINTIINNMTSHQIECILIQLGNMIKSNLSYPSYTDHCNRCTYRKECGLC